MASVKQPRLEITSLFHILLVSLVISQASLLLRPALARALDADRKLLPATDWVTEQAVGKAAENATTEDHGVDTYGHGGSGGHGSDDHKRGVSTVATEENGGEKFGHGGGYGHGHGGHHGHGAGTVATEENVGEKFGHGGGGYGHGHGDHGHGGGWGHHGGSTAGRH